MSAAVTAGARRVQVGLTPRAWLTVRGVGLPDSGGGVWCDTGAVDVRRCAMTAGPSWVVAIDFGTTATAAAVRVEGKAVAELRMPDAASAMSSSVFAEDDGQLVVGVEA